MTAINLTEVLNTVIMEALANVHTTVLAKVTAVNTKTINVLPVIARKVDGVLRELPEFIEVPPIFLQGGTSYTAYPIAIDDYCLLLISERCFDRWYGADGIDGQDFVEPAEFRMHDYSDALAIVGINPLADAITIPTEIQRVGDYTQTGDVTHVGDYHLTGNFTIIGNLDITGDITMIGDFDLTGLFDVTGNIICSGNISATSFSGLSGGTMIASGDIQTSGEVTASGIALSTHTHDYTWTDPGGSGTTATPN